MKITEENTVYKMKVNAPEIKIIGLPKSGKSTLAFAIKAALEAHGIPVAITGDEDERQGVLEATWTNRIPRLKGQAVVVKTERRNVDTLQK